MAAPAFDAYTLGAFDWGSGSSPYAVQISHTCGGTNRYLFVDILDDRGSNAITACKYNGVAMTLLATVRLLTSGWYHWRYGLVNPASGAHTVSVERSSQSGQLKIAAQSYKDVDQTTPIGTTVTGQFSNGVGNLTVTVTAPTGSIAVGSGRSYGADITAGSGQTLTYSYWSGGYLTGWYGSYQAGAGSTSTTWNGTGAWEGSAISTPLNPVAAAAIPRLSEEIEEEY